MDGILAGIGIGVIFLTALAIHATRGLKHVFLVLGVAFINFSLLLALIFREFGTSKFVAIFVGWFGIAFASSIKAMYSIGKYGKILMLTLLTLMWLLVFYISEWPLIMFPLIVASILIILCYGVGEVVT